MRQLFRKWWFWLIVVLVILIILSILPIWCTSYYLPDQATKTAVEHSRCGPIFDLFKVY